MAIKKPLQARDEANEVRDFVPAAYFRVMDVSIRASTGRVRIDVGGYISEASRQSTDQAGREDAALIHKASIECKLSDLGITLPGKGVQLTGDDIKAAAYAHIKTLPAYSGGEDA